MTNRRMRLIWGIPCGIMLLLAACGNPSMEGPEARNPKAVTHGDARKETLPAIPPSEQQKQSQKAEAKVPDRPLPDPGEEEPEREKGSDEVEWGEKISLDEMIAKAKSGEIREIQWHVMPNILRAQTVDNRIFHLKNENKGVDLRNALINAGVKVGEGGVIFRHVF
jgi:hypothetical protein